MHKIATEAAELAAESLKTYINEEHVGLVTSYTSWKKEYGKTNKQDYLKAVEEGIKKALNPRSTRKYKLKVENASNDIEWAYRIVLSFPKVLFRKIE